VLFRSIKKMREVRKPEMTLLERNFKMKFPRKYLKKINAICKQEDIRVYFMYIPEYASNCPLPKEYQTYKKYGKILIPPHEIFDTAAHWHDEDHLNQAGAKELSEWVTAELKNDLQF
jgi:hypothetical protein